MKDYDWPSLATRERLLPERKVENKKGGGGGEKKKEKERRSTLKIQFTCLAPSLNNLFPTHSEKSYLKVPNQKS